MASTDPANDPHPRETRYLSEKFSNFVYGGKYPDEHGTWDLLKSYSIVKILRSVTTNPRFFLLHLTIDFSCNRVLRRAGLPAAEPDTLHDMKFDVSESEFEEEKANWPGFISEYDFNVPPEANMDVAGAYQAYADQLFHDWNGKCINARANMKGLTEEYLDNLWLRVASVLRDPPNLWNDEVNIGMVCDKFTQRVREEKTSLKASHWNDLENGVDPDFVPAAGLQDRYRAWTVVQDVSVNGHGMGPWRYQISELRRGEIPMEVYRWFGAEVVSPVLPQNAPETPDKIRRVCATLRNYFRIHKPMEVSTGLHVHLGHKHGWNLLQVKRFVTLWYLCERALIHCHRKDRDGPKMFMWCASMGEGTRLAAYLFHIDQLTRQDNECEPRTTPTKKEIDLGVMRSHVVPINLSAKQREFLEKVWTYTTISELNGALWGRSAPGVECITAARMRLSGQKTSYSADYSLPQTIEIRTMHGTLDGNHVNHWIAVLRRIMHYVRNVPAVEFQELTTRILDEIENETLLWRLLQILDVPEETRKFYAHPFNRVYDINTRGSWFTYPDKDIVDWADPFMERGHAGTHGNHYDELAPYP
ncbi:uncharacterized protein GGS22DRAFT_68212 [Annulohypoxylon maeteangense]|uniref:uncharacterized protein n=1 Tax=Annulohypoxylon maeteangense TaxID=1927788 RepID=UPI002007AD14|nr:uncharacterized protein GGS22DRAFT_68212 [Annulohypoxylon maeteangense]KAI0889168.1 hypothetical protein GGS22DRAFT_68212 [Annulohypoxylon maeteangense]